VSLLLDPGQNAIHLFGTPAAISTDDSDDVLSEPEPPHGPILADLEARAGVPAADGGSGNRADPCPGRLKLRCSYVYYNG
jgi:hypothetical protein